MLRLRHGRVWRDGVAAPADVVVRGDRVVAPDTASPGPTREVDLGGAVVLPGLVNAHDHLDFAGMPPLGRPPYRSVYEWAAEVDAGAGDGAVRDALAVPLADRLFLGGVRNLVSGVTAVAHHNPYHRSLGRSEFPVRVLSKYSFAHSPGLTPQLRRTYRTTDRRIPWMIHAAEGIDDRCRGELAALAEAHLLRQNTVLVHGVALSPEDAPRLAAARTGVVWCPESNRRLYGATAPVSALRQAGVAVGLGSDSPVSGVRDPLSNLRAARAEDVFDDVELLQLATRESAAVARLPLGGFEPGAVADLLVASSVEELLAGERRAVLLVLVAGRPLYGEPGLMQAAGAAGIDGTVDGAPRRLAAAPGRRLAGLIRGHSCLHGVPWISGLGFD